jgi:hypothetical protein
MIAKKKTPERELSGMPFDEAIARLLQTNPKEVADEIAQVKARQEEVRTNVKEAERYIDTSGRPRGKRFRL